MALWDYRLELYYPLYYTPFYTSLHFTPGDYSKTDDAEYPGSVVYVENPDLDTVTIHGIFDLDRGASSFNLLRLIWYGQLYLLLLDLPIDCNFYRAVVVVMLIWHRAPISEAERGPMVVDGDSMVLKLTWGAATLTYEGEDAHGRPVSQIW